MKEKICQNCGYYVQHYRKNFAGDYSEVGCGHCVSTKNKRFRKTTKICECYTEKDSAAEIMQRHMTVKHRLSAIIKQLSDLSKALND